MRNARGIACAVLLIASLVAQPPRLSGQQAIQLGLFVPMTGPDAEVGDQINRGARAAVSNANTRGGAGGRQIDLVVRDVSCDSSDPAFRQFVESHHLLAVLGLVCRSSLQAAEDYLKSHQLMAISVEQFERTSATSSFLYTSDLQVPATTAIVRYATEHANARTLAFYVDAKSPGTIPLETRAAWAADLGTKVVAVDRGTVSSNTAAFIATEQRSKGVNAAILLSQSLTDAPLALDSYRKAAPDLHLLGWVGPITVESTLKKTPASAGVVFPLFYRSTPELTNLLRQGTPPDGLTLWTYDLTSMWVNALRGASAIDPMVIMNSFDKLQYQGLAGRLSVLQPGPKHIVKEFILATQREGRLLQIQPAFLCIPICPCWPYCPPHK